MNEKRTPIGKFIHTTWGNLNIRCANGKYRQITSKNACYDNVFIMFSRDEFKEWCYNNENLILSLQKPSIDRIDKNKNYTLENIQVIELTYNIAKDKISFINGYGICWKCKEKKEITNFVDDKRRLYTGKTTICRDCERARCRDKNKRKSQIKGQTI